MVSKLIFELFIDIFSLTFYQSDVMICSHGCRVGLLPYCTQSAIAVRKGLTRLDRSPGSDSEGRGIDVEMVNVFTTPESGRGERGSYPAIIDLG